MKKVVSLVAVVFFLGAILSAAAYAGDNHRNSHQGSKGKGTVIKNKHQKR